MEILQKNENKMDIAALKVTVALSGKKWDKAMKNLAQHGLTSVKVEGDFKIVELKE